MLFFKRILNFRRDALAKLRDKRKTARYPVGPGFPLKATVSLMGRDTLGRSDGATRGGGCDWSGRLADLSNNGACVKLPPAATTVRAEQSELKLLLETRQLLIPCTVAHFRTNSNYALCGLSLQFGDFTVQKAYLQLVEAVSMGASIVSVEPTGSMPNPSGLAGEQYRADNRAMLTAWRRTKTGQLDSFELVVGDHCVRGETGAAALEVYARPKGSGTEKAALPAAVDDEVRQLFRWVVPNLSKAVPADLRRLMARLAIFRPPPPNIPVAPLVETGSQTRSSPSPSPHWQPPKPARKGSGLAPFPQHGGPALSLPRRPHGPA